MTTTTWHAKALTLQPDGRAFIAGERRAAQDEQTFENHSPIDGRLLGLIARGRAADIDLAVSAARSAFDDSRWARKAPAARKKIMQRWSDLILVVGSKNSSNSVRLVEVALRAGAGDARLIDDATQIDWNWLEGVSTVGVTAGASAPEPLVEAVVRALKDRFDVTLADDPGERETVTFKLPRALTS